MTALGIAVVIAGIVLIAYEAHVPATGLIGGAGVLALLGGLVLALTGIGAGIALAVIVAAVVAAAAGGALGFVARRTLSVRRSLPRGGANGMLGHIGVARDWNGESGRVFVDGALWRARACARHHEEEEDIERGDPVVVNDIRGLTLEVRKAEPWEVL